jgi:hypothetical protein
MPDMYVNLLQMVTIPDFTVELDKQICLTGVTKVIKNDFRAKCCQSQSNHVFSLLITVSAR